MSKLIHAGALTAAVFAATACAQSSESSMDREAIEEIVHAYIVENPEVIEEALINLQAQAEARETEAQRAAIAQNMDDIYKDDSDYGVGPEDAPVTIVEFVAYDCIFCQRSLDWTMGLPEKYDGKVRVVFKDYARGSEWIEQAALAALAAGEQGKYLEMHKELFADSERTMEAILAAAERAGVDAAQMQADMESVKIRKALADTMSLSRRINVNATPTFLIGETVVAGARADMVDSAIQSELAELEG